ncbi:MAG TPA: response regulator transcription factor [Melioribacteraceae bacterium]|nr:response regulator transcription factor [Melioribacteraceae bacterium]
MNILITDDHEIIREGIKKILSRNEDLKIVAEASSVKEMEEIINNTQIDLLMLDISLPDKSGLDIVKDLKSRYPETKILVFSIFPEEKFAKRAINQGADGYISKNAKPSEIINAIRKIEKGGKYLNLEIMEELFLSSQKNRNALAHELLSNREFEVLRLLAQGKKITEIADSLSLSINTIASYKTRIQNKLNRKSTADLIRYAIDNNLIE